MTDRSAGELADLVARRYADRDEVEHYAKRAGDGLRPWEAWVRAQYLSNGSRVLDVGCGAGREAIALAAHGLRVVCVDIGRELLARAAAQALRRGVGLELVRVDGRTLPFAEATFDHVALWSQVLANVPGGAARTALLDEARRVLRPGGAVSFSVHDRDATEVLAGAESLAAARADRRLSAGDLIMRDSPVSETACYWHYFTPQEIRVLVRKVGLRVERCARASELGDPERHNLWVCIAARA